MVMDNTIVCLRKNVNRKVTDLNYEWHLPQHMQTFDP